MLNKIKNNIPNMITCSRIISSVIAAMLFINGSLLASICFYAYGAISDCFDGLAARKLNAFTELGRKLDPFSDKMFALSLIIPSLVLGNYLMLIPFFLEGEIASINISALKLNKKTQTERVGKYKTVSLFPTMILGLMATKSPVCYLFLCPMLIISTYLQVQSIKEYEKQLSNKLQNKSIITNEISNIEQVKELKNTTNRKRELEKIKEELMMYSIPITDNIKRKGRIK